MSSGRTPVAGRPTMRDVGLVAGVSAMTVSRVLSGDARVAPETRVRVETAIAQLRYRRDDLARSLRPGRSTGVLGLVVPNLGMPFYARLALSVEKAISQFGLTLIVGNTDRDVVRERQLVERLLSRRVDGMLIEPTGKDQTHLAVAIQDTPIVFVCHPPVGIAADCVLNDDFGGARAATLDLAARGHTRIAFAGYAARAYTNAQRLRGYRAALRQHRIVVPPRYVVRDVPDAQATERRMRALFSAPDPPTAVFTAHNLMTVGTVRAMHEVGYRVEIAQFGTFDLADMLGCPLTIAVNGREQLADTAVRMLLDRIGGQHYPPRRVYVRTSLQRQEPLWHAGFGRTDGLTATLPPRGSVRTAEAAG